MITLEEARNIAYDWHGGMWSGLYSFASTGKFCEAALQDARECYDGRMSREDEVELRSLIEFLEAQS